MVEQSDIPLDKIYKWYELMLSKAEELFGDRNSEWTFGGIIFQDDGPEIRYFHSELKFKIWLNTKCRNDEKQLKYQLAHETCHGLYPTGYRNANILEEGVSTYFSRYYFKVIEPDTQYDAVLDNYYASKEIPAYVEAYILVKKLLTQHPNAIRRIREQYPTISYLTVDQLLSFHFDLSEDEINLLLRKFIQRKARSECRFLFM